jgi:hypothetical protein
MGFLNGAGLALALSCGRTTPYCIPSALPTVAGQARTWSRSFLDRCLMQIFKMLALHNVRI